MLQLSLYVSGMTPNARTQLERLAAILDATLGRDGYRLRVKDVFTCPDEAYADAVYATPTLIRHLPPPAARIIGDLSRRERILLGLNLEGTADSGDAVEPAD
jgi:circadian clock protein KaiB